MTALELVELLMALNIETLRHTDHSQHVEHAFGDRFRRRTRFRGSIGLLPPTSPRTGKRVSWTAAALFVTVLNASLPSAIAQTHVLVSRTPDGVPAPDSNGLLNNILDPDIGTGRVVSDDGRSVLFHSAASLDAAHPGKKGTYLYRDEVVRWIGTGQHAQFVASDTRVLFHGTAPDDDRVGIWELVLATYTYEFVAPLDWGFVSASSDGRYIVGWYPWKGFVPDAQLWLYDRLLRDTELISVTVDGNPSVSPDRWFTLGIFQRPSVSDDGRWVAFASFNGDLVPADTNGGIDVFLRDRLNATTKRLSVGPNGEQANGAFPMISGAGNRVVFNTSSPVLDPLLLTHGGGIVAWDRDAGKVSRVSPPLSELQAGPDPLANRQGVPSISNDGNRVAYTWGYKRFQASIGPTYVSDLSTGTTWMVAVPVVGDVPNDVFMQTAISRSGRAVVHTTRASNLVGGDPPYSRMQIVLTTCLEGPELCDTDGDGMTDGWETFFGLDPNLQDGHLDSDGDGVTNLEEYYAGTHPHGTVRAVLAEGASNDFFRTELALANPSSEPARVLLRYQKGDATSVSSQVLVPAMSRVTINPADLHQMTRTEFATVIESDVPLAVDRTMTWDQTAYGAHTERAVPGVGESTWYFAEGATHSGFQLFYLLQNPGQQVEHVEATFLRPSPLPPLTKVYTLAPGSRFNVWVNHEAASDPALTGLAATDISARFRSLSGAPIVAERAMYLSSADQPMLKAGHESAGVTALATQWFFAEGATGPFFDLFLLIGNPGLLPARVEARYLLPNGDVVTRTYTVEAQSRESIWVDLEDTRLADTAVSTTLTSLDGVPIVAERAMWWPGQPVAERWHEAHNSPGTTQAGTRWATAGGENGGALGRETYVLIANTSPFAGEARVTVLFEDRPPVTRIYPLKPQSRFNVAVGAMFPETHDRRFGVLVESLGDTPAALVVERATYHSVGGYQWAAGTNALATKLP